MSAETIIKSIWARGTGQYVFTPQMERKPERWIEGEAWTNHHQASVDQPWGNDCYFTPLTFSQPRRSNLSAAPGSVLYADLDGSLPEQAIVHPTIAWETSPGLYQAVWFTHEVMSPQEQSALNRRMTYACHADRGGWMGSKVLRVPDTLNFKRAYEDDYGLVVPKGKILWETEYAYSRDQLESMLPLVPNAGEALHIEPPEADDKALSRNWHHLSMHMRAWLNGHKPDDRSLHIFKVLHGLKAEDISPEDAFSMVWFQDWNKFHGRPEGLWAEVSKVYSAQ